jgi:hypothetical protein
MLAVIKRRPSVTQGESTGKQIDPVDGFQPFVSFPGD